jgi:GNAT superfamily N-acetyltransferase
MTVASRARVDGTATLTARGGVRRVWAGDECRRRLHPQASRLGIESPTTAAARFCLASYFAELDARFDAGFDPGRSISASDAELTEPAGLLLVAWLRGEPVGCGGLKLHRRAPAELKRMWVAPAARGLGVGRRILQELEAHARERGARRVRLETNRTLREATTLYRSAGYTEVAAFNDEPYAHHWFEKRL